MDIFANGHIDVRDTMAIVGNQDGADSDIQTDPESGNLMGTNTQAPMSYMPIEKVKERIV